MLSSLVQVLVLYSCGALKMTVLHSRRRGRNCDADAVAGVLHSALFSLLFFFPLHDARATRRKGKK